MLLFGRDLYNMADSKSILVLGCGLCSPPMIKFFNENKIKTSVASRTLSRAEAVCKDLEYVTPIQFDVEAEGAMEKLEPLVQAHDLIISMLPYIHHCKAARVAIKHKKHFCTTSYVSDEVTYTRTHACKHTYKHAHTRTYLPLTDADPE